MNKEQEKFIRKNYRQMSYKKVADKIGATHYQVRYFCIKNGLKRTSQDEFNIRSRANRKKIKKVDDAVPHYHKKQYNHFDFI